MKSGIIHDKASNVRNTQGLRLQGEGAQGSDIFFWEQIGKSAAMKFHVWSGGRDGVFDFHNTGEFRASGGATFGGNIHVSWGGHSAIFHGNGDVTGPIWGGALSTWLHNQLNSRGAKNTANRAINGWFKCGDTGLIIQWGKTDSESLDRKILPLPLPFPNEGLWALGWVAEAIWIGADQCSHSAGLVDKAHIKVTTDYDLATAWIAIGY